MTATVVVLNASYEPLSTTRVARAIALVMNGVAVIEESDPLRQFRHKGGSFPYPRLIRLLKFIKVPFTYGPQPWSKRGVLRRDNNTCAYCGKHADTIDHVMPTSRGGHPRDWTNTVGACLKCNSRKADRTLKEAGMKLLVTPYVPKRARIDFS